jgi:hypothetical protein
MFTRIGAALCAFLCATLAARVFGAVSQRLGHRIMCADAVRRDEVNGLENRSINAPHMPMEAGKCGAC